MLTLRLRCDVETIARAFLSPFSNFERLGRANGDAIEKVVREFCTSLTWNERSRSAPSCGAFAKAVATRSRPEPREEFRRALDRERRAKTPRAPCPGRSRRDAMSCVRTQTSYSTQSASNRDPNPNFVN